MARAAEASPRERSEGNAVTKVNSAELKPALRKQVRAALARISREEAIAASNRACILLRTQSIWQRATSILFYASLPSELDLSPLLREALAKGKTVALPRFVEETGLYAAFQITDTGEGLTPGTFGVPEPSAGAPSLALNQLDLALVPGIAFDKDGRRLGRGKGFYDRLLAAVPGAKCGVAFDCQVVSEIPVESHDVLMNFVLTPTRWLAFSRSAA